MHRSCGSTALHWPRRRRTWRWPACTASRATAVMAVAVWRCERACERRRTCLMMMSTGSTRPLTFTGLARPAVGQCDIEISGNEDRQPELGSCRLMDTVHDTNGGRLDDLCIALQAVGGSALTWPVARWRPRSNSTSCTSSCLSTSPPCRPEHNAARHNMMQRLLTNGGTTFRSDGGTTNPEPLSANRNVQHHTTK